MLESVRHSDHTPEWRQLWEDAFDFLIDFAEVELKARAYPFTLEGSSPDHPGLRLELDRERDRNHLDKDDLLAHYELEGHRTAFGDFLDAYETDDLHLWLDVYDTDERFHWRADRQTARYITRHARKTIFVEGPRLPSKGWLIPKDERGSREMWFRQREARKEFFDAWVRYDAITAIEVQTRS